jgi:hypothetical protein
MFPILAHGQGLIPLMAGGGLAAVCFLWGLGLWLSGKPANRRNGTRFMLSGMTLFLLTLILSPWLIRIRVFE